MRTKLVISLFLGCFLASCGSKKLVRQTSKKPVGDREVVTTPELPKTPEVEEIPKVFIPRGNDVTSQYIGQFKEIAMEEMRRYGIPASITLAQGILESGSGNGELAQRSKNHFGIKCHGDWTGQRVYHDDDARGECFRKYRHPKISYRDHSLFLFERKRYFPLFKLPKDDYKGWAKGLKQAGYATDPKYPNKLIGLIERYRLYELDAMVLGKELEDAKKMVKKKDRYTVKKGDTLYSIAKRHKLKVDELKELNGLEGNNIFEGQVLFVKPVKKNF